MLTVSGTAMWLPLYALILWLVWRRSGWRGVIVFTVLMIAALALVGHEFRASSSTTACWAAAAALRTALAADVHPPLEGLEIAPDSLRAAAHGRHAAATGRLHVPSRP